MSKKAALETGKSAKCFRDCYARLSVDEQCQVFHLVGLLACAGSGTLASNDTGRKRARTGTCSLCDGGSGVGLVKSVWDKKPGEEIFLTLSKLLEGNHLQTSPRPRIAAMTTLRRLIMHTENAAYLDLANSYLAQWCLQSLRSSLRELRISAGFVFVHVCFF